MSFNELFSVAGSGMSAHSMRLNTIASNISNANTVAGDEKSAYRARYPVFEAAQPTFAQTLGKQLGDEAVGVDVKGVVESAAPVKQEYRPNHPMANENGYIFLPNVNVMTEMANMISASQAYSTNVEVMNTGKQLMLQTLRMGQ